MLKDERNGNKFEVKVIELVETGVYDLWLGVRYVGICDEMCWRIVGRIWMGDIWWLYEEAGRQW